MDSATISLLFFAGLGAGFIDAIAGGGGLIALPALLSVGLPPQLALGTNKLQSSCGTLLAVTRYAKAGLIRWPEVRLAFFVSFAFAALGTVAVTQVSNEVLRRIVPWMLFSIAVYTAVSPRLGAGGRAARLTPAVFACVFGALLGFYDGFFGPGTGSFWTIACIAMLGLDLPRATGYTKAVNLASNLASLLAFSLAGQVQLPMALIMIAGQLIGARLGSGLVIKHGAPFIRMVFLAVVFALTIKLLWDQF